MKKKIRSGVILCMVVALVFLTPISVDKGKCEYLKMDCSIYDGNGEWNKTFGGEKEDRGYSIQETHDGGYIVAGDTESFSSGGDLDFWLIKTDGYGKEQWNKTFGGNGMERCFCVRQTTDLGYIMVGWKYIADRWADVWLIKTDENGNELWNKTFGDSNWNGGYCVQQTEDGGYIMVGNTYTSGHEDSDIWLIKTDSSGNIEWTKLFGGNKSDYGYSVQQVNDGGYIIAGTTDSFGAEHWDVWLIKTDNDGNEIWNTTFGGSDYDMGKCVQQTSDGGYIIVGSIGKDKNYWYTQTDIWLIKTDENGNELWNKTFGTNHHDRGEYVQQISDEGFIIVGETVNVRSSLDYNNYDIFDIWLIKTDLLGNEKWMKKIGKEGYDYAHAVQQTTDGKYIIVGETSSPTDSYFDIWLIKTGEPTLQIEGSCGSVVIKNTGEEDLSDLKWSIYVDGMVLTGGYTHGIIASLPAGGQAVIKNGFVFGFGPATIIVTVEETAITLRCFLIGFLMWSI